jgi:hypothetical protein
VQLQRILAVGWSGRARGGEIALSKGFSGSKLPYYSHVRQLEAGRGMDSMGR